MKPALILLYGDSKTGKTSAVIAAFPRAYFVGKQAAFDCQSVWGFTLYPQQFGTARTIDDLIAVVREVGSQHDSKGNPIWNAVVGDDLTLMIDLTVAQLEPSYKNKMQLYGAIKTKLVFLRDAAEETGVNVIFTAHSANPIYWSEDDREVKRGLIEAGTLKLNGGPAIVGQMRQGLPAVCNQVLRAEKQSTTSKIVPPGYWPAVLRVEMDEPWIVGDRSDCMFDGAPLNLRELLREAARREAIASGATSYVALPRFPGLDWQEEAVERLAPLFIRHGFAATDAAKVDWNLLITQAEDDTRTRYRVKNERHIRWCVGDALAAAQYRHRHTQPFARYGVKAAAAAGPASAFT